MAGKKQFYEDLPEGVREYIDSIIKRLLRGKVRKQVRQELIDHFTDGLVNCDSKQEKEERAKKLIEEFGKAKMLAKMINRVGYLSIPRWLRATMWSIFLLYIIFILYKVFFTVWFILGEPTVRVDYVAQLNEMVRPEAEDDQNAWLQYEKAIDLYVEPNDEISDIVSWTNCYGHFESSFFRMQEDEQEDIQGFIEKHNAEWDNLSEKYKKQILAAIKDNRIKFCEVISPESEIISEPNIIKSFDLKEAIEDIRKAIKRDDLPFKKTKIVRTWIGPMGPGGMMGPMGPGGMMGPMGPGGMMGPMGHGGMMEPGGMFGAEEEEELKIGDPNDPEGMRNIKLATAVQVLREWMRVSENGVMGDSIWRNEIIEWIKQNEAARRKYEEGTRQHYFWWEYKSKRKSHYLNCTSYAPHGSLRDLSRLGIWHSYWLIEQGEIEQTMEDYLAAVRAGRHFQNKTLFIFEQLSGLAVANMGQRRILQILLLNEVQKDLLEETQRQLEEIYESGYPLVGIMSERMIFMDMVQRVFTEGGPGGGHILFKEWYNLENINDEKGTLFNIGGLYHAERDETVAKGNEIFDYYDELIKMSPYEQRENKKISRPDILSSLTSRKYSFIDIMVNDVARGGVLSYRGKTLHEAVVTVLALRRWELEKGGYPERLGELVEEGYLGQLPDDPYSGGILRYERRGEDFVLYSVGADFDDDGGVENEEDSWGHYEEGGDRVFWPIGER